MEARALVRLLNENLLWLGALRERGPAFVQDMIADQRHNDAVIARATMRLTSKHGGDASSEGALKLRSIIRSFDKQTPKGKKLHADEIAAQGVVELAYVDYLAFSLDALHCSVEIAWDDTCLVCELKRLTNSPLASCRTRRQKRLFRPCCRRVAH